jgi:hypothetical protein
MNWLRRAADLREIAMEARDPWVRRELIRSCPRMQSARDVSGAAIPLTGFTDMWLGEDLLREVGREHVRRRRS